MNVLDSPLEALAFDYVSFGLSIFAGNLWTWIAVVTAAVSFWRIRGAGGGFPPEESPTKLEMTQTTPLSPPPPEMNKKLPSREPSFAEEVGVLTQGSPKFAAYYFEDDVTHGDATASEEEEEELTVTTTEGELVRGYGNGDGEEWWGSWEKALRTMSGESEMAGWYRYQDLTELNGNVVKLWDSCHRRGRRTRTGRNAAFCGGPLLMRRNYD